MNITYDVFVEIQGILNNRINFTNELQNKMMDQYNVVSKHNNMPPSIVDKKSDMSTFLGQYFPLGYP